MSFTTTSLTSTLGAYFREQDPFLVKRIAHGMPSAKKFRVVNTKSEVPLISITGASLVRPQLHDNAWNPVSGSVNFQPRILKVRPAKVDISLIPAALWDTYLGVAAMRGSADQTKMPFEQFIFEYLLDKIVEETELNTVFKGIYNSGGTGAADITTGFLKIVTDELAGGGITSGQKATTGAITTSNAYDSVWAVYKLLASIPQMLDKPTVAIMSFDTYMKYVEDYSAQFTSAPYNTSFDKKMLHGTQCELLPLAAMGTSSRIIITQADNFVIGFDLEEDMQKLQIQQNRRGIDVMCDFRIGTQIADLRFLVCNEQA